MTTPKDTDIADTYPRTMALDINDEQESTSAGERVFGVTELLECIISYVPLRDAITARSVSKGWRAVVIHSNFLSKCCFLQPTKLTPPSTAIWIADDRFGISKSRAKACIQQQLTTRTTVFHDTRDIDITPAMVQKTLSQNNNILLNPLIDRVIRYHNSTYRANFRQMEASLGKAQPNRSWVEMFLTQPPTSTVSIKVPSSNLMPLTLIGVNDESEIINPSGVTIGDIAAWLSSLGELHRHYRVRMPVYAGVLGEVHDATNFGDVSVSVKG